MEDPELETENNEGVESADVEGEPQADIQSANEEKQEEDVVTEQAQSDETQIPGEEEEGEFGEESELKPGEESFDTKLKQIKSVIASEEKEITNGLEDEASVRHKYKMACLKYKVFPLLKCIESIDQEVVDFSNLCLSPLSFRPIVESLFFSPTLTHLSLPGNRIGVEGLKRIAFLFAANSNIKHLNLANNFLGAKGGDYIEKILANGFNLEFLDLSGNGLRDLQLTKMTRALNDCFKLHQLNLRENNFQGGSGKNLGQCLASNDGLHKLDLSYNKFKAGASEIFSGLRTNACLKTLILTGNELGPECAQDLGKALETNTCLEELDISANMLTKESMVVISKGVKSNGTLKYLNMAYNPIFAQGAATLIAALAGGENKIERLDLSGIRVNLPFLKTVHSIRSSGRDFEVTYGHRTRSECCKGLGKKDAGKNSSLMQVMQLADKAGVSLKTVLQKVHMKFFVDRKLQLEKLAAAAAEKDAETKFAPVDDLYPRMEGSKFVQSLVNSAIKAPEDLAQKLAEDFIDESGTLDVGEIILKIPLRADEIEHQQEESKPGAEQNKKADAKKK